MSPDRVAIDRVACSGHGICAQLLPAAVALDEWGYPIVADVPVDARDLARAQQLCPARAVLAARPATSTTTATRGG